ncbi:MAG: Fur family transcriptional regulator [Candidatus Calescibacterium sp.]|nr:transcriptional repressor [Candidatus Calescibacterium sp.]MCX7971873.1 transcriptional repressor [bacterium]MDW8195028.1 Fur family transcriptional regulator [Candidatus Calescibacterium sp.]
MKAKEILEKNNIKPSIIRLKILEYLIENRTHPTADEIYNHLKKEIPTLSKTSVYLNLNLFLKKKIIQDIKMKEEQRFDYMEQYHLNFYCISCKKIFDLPVKELKISIDNQKFLVEKINIYLEGICENCG